MKLLLNPDRRRPRPLRRHLVLVSRLLATFLLLPSLYNASAQTPDSKAVELFRAALPQLRAAHPEQYDTPKKLQTAWKGFLQTLALARTARALGYADRPEISYRIEQLLAQELILQNAETARPIHAITETEIDAYLDANRGKFESPALMSAHEIVVRFEPQKKGDRSAQLTRAQAIHRSLGEGPVSIDRFTEAIKTHSDPDFARTNVGYLGVISVSAISNATPPMAPAAAEQLLSTGVIGRISDVHEFGQAFRIYRFSGYREPVRGSSAAVRDGVRRALYLQARENRIQELAARSGMNLDGDLNEQEVNELLASSASSRVSAGDLPPSPAGADIPLAEPVSTKRFSK